MDVILEIFWAKATYALLDPPVGRSGVNHRLRKLKEIAEEL